MTANIIACLHVQVKWWACVRYRCLFAVYLSHSQILGNIFSEGLGEREFSRKDSVTGNSHGRTLRLAINTFTFSPTPSPCYYNRHRLRRFSPIGLLDCSSTPQDDHPRSAARLWYISPPSYIFIYMYTHTHECRGADNFLELLLIEF